MQPIVGERPDPHAAPAAGQQRAGELQQPTSPPRADGVPQRLYLSPPHMTGREMDYIREAFETNWIAPLGPHVDAFEEAFCAATGARHAVALSSGTAALHLALVAAGVGPGDEVLLSTLTFCASANPVVYLGARPVFVDSDETWNLDAALLCEAVTDRVRAGRPPAAVIVVHLYGGPANLEPVIECCRIHGIPLIEDAAEALGARWQDRSPGTLGDTGIFSFNGNKILSTSGGGMLVSEDAAVVARIRKLATQARDPAPHYEHSEIGYNYRMSNVLAGIGRAQLAALPSRVAARRQNFAYYRDQLGPLPGVSFMPEPSWGMHSRWLTTLTIDPAEFGASREDVMRALEAADIESRPVWKPMHMQPVFRDCETVGGRVAEELFTNGLCLPSGSQMSPGDLDRVTGIVRSLSSGY